MFLWRLDQELCCQIYWQKQATGFKKQVQTAPSQQHRQDRSDMSMKMFNIWSLIISLIQSKSNGEIKVKIQMLTYWCHNGVLWFKLKNNFEMMSQGGQTLFWSSALGWIYLYFFPYFDRFVYGTSRIQQYDHRHWSAQSVKTMWTSQSETFIPVNTQTTPN